MERWRTERLCKAAQEEDTDTLYKIIEEDPYILERIDGIPFSQTPLHVSAAAGHTHFAMEIMRLKPSFARKLNQEGQSPLHLALLHEETWMVHRFVHSDTGLVRVKGRDSTTPLHYVVATENMLLLALFLSACPESIEDLTIRMESALHIAVKHHKLEVFKFLVRWLERVDKEEILNWPDEDRNSVLHIATSTNQTQVVKLLLSKKIVKKINKQAVNFAGMTALDIFELSSESYDREIGNMLRRARVLRASSGETLYIADYIQAKMSLSERLGKCLGLSGHKLSPSDMWNMVLVVAVLIATTTFQAALSPPGGFWHDSNPQAPNASASTDDDGLQQEQVQHHAGKVIMDAAPFALFSFLNSAAFYASIGMIRVLTIGLGYDLLQISLFFLCFTYFYSLAYTMPTMHGPLDWIAFSVLLVTNVTCVCGVFRISAVMGLQSYVIQQRQVNAVHRRLA